MSGSFWEHAAETPERVALVTPNGQEWSTAALRATSGRFAAGLRAIGCQTGDVVAFVMHNTAEILALSLATAEAGIYFVPVNWHLTAAEIGYILADSDAKAVFCSPQTAECVTAAADIAGLSLRYCTEAVEGFSLLSEFGVGAPPVSDRLAGGVMSYTSGTTGQPKGVRRPLPPYPPEPVAAGHAGFLAGFGLKPGGVHLVVSPLYHTAVLYYATNTLHLGQTVVLMDRWTPAGTLERIEKYRVTNSHMVPTQLVRLLKERPSLREYDVSSLLRVIHGAAPCPKEVKRQMLEWWGEVIYEYYAATEGGGTIVSPQEWLQRPGTVGKPWAGAEIRIYDDEGTLLSPDEIGTVFIKMAQGFTYHKDPTKTDRAWNPDGFFTVGDAGYLDADGYLYLCDRKADMIISGGVNIYPAEIEGVLINHPAVMDVAVFGIPDADWGEQVKAVIEIRSPVTEAELMAFAADKLAKYKCPRSIEFVDALPRDPNGKLAKRKLRDPYWAGTGRSI
ncbi:MAG: long-chain acyl-CoA synthetase [Myxococcota bacterium]|jgi:long-chain acyl-CoA synthetase